MKTCRSGLHQYEGIRCLECKKLWDVTHKDNRKINPISLPVRAKAQARWRKNNPQKHAQQQYEWRKKNKEKYQASFRVTMHNRRAKIINNGGKLSKGLFEKLSILQKNKCACCNADLKKIKAHMDHVMPLYLGGQNIDSNIQLLCQPCNSKKHAKHPVDFMQSQGYLI